MRFSFYLPFLAPVLILAWGCQSASTAKNEETATHFYYQDTDSNQDGKQVEDPSKVAQNGVSKADLVPLTKKKDAAEAAMKASPSRATKAAFVQANDKLAYSTMYCDDLTSHDKYAGALRLYRASLKVDPQDDEASKTVKTIVDIYKSLGKPVPSD